MRRTALGSSERGTGALVFSTFCLDLDNERLQNGTDVVKLKPKAFAVLRYLVERPRVLVTKDELMNALWGETHVGDGVLKTQLNELRRALGDDVHSPSFIETVSRRGYRFVAEVKRARHATRPQGGAAPRTIMVGREPELELLGEAWESSLRGERRIVFMTGEAGLGKSFLVDSFVDRFALDEGVLVARGHCIEHHGAGEAYLPILEALGRLCRGSNGARVISALRNVAPNWLAQMPELVAPSSQAALVDTKATPERMLREMSNLIPSVTEALPLILILEDLHWADYSTLALIDHLARCPDAAQFLLIGTHRPQELVLSSHPLRGLTQSVQTLRHCLQIQLGFLAPTDVAAYLDARFEKNRFSPELARVLHRHTAGNPLFMVHVVDTLQRQGIIRKEGEAWLLVGSLDAVGQSVPESVVGLIERNLERLDTVERVILEIASVVGTEFDSLTIAAAAESDASAVEEVCMRWSAQGRFIRVQRVQECSQGRLSLQCSFMHALYRQVVYDRIGPTRQTDLHRRIGVYEAEREQARISAASLARHFEHARDYARAIHYRRSAGQDALRRSAYREAIEHFRAALAMSERMPDAAEKRAVELDLLLAMAVPLTITFGYTASEAGDAYRRASLLCKLLPDRDRAPIALIGVASFQVAAGAPAQAEQTGYELLEIARHQANTAAQLDALLVLGVSKFYQGELAAAAELLERCVSMYEPERCIRRDGLYHIDPKATALSYLAWTSWLRGEPHRALVQAADAEAFARQTEDPFTLNCALTFTALLQHSRRDRIASIRIVRELTDLTTEHGFAFSQSTVKMIQGALDVEAGNKSQGLDVLRSTRAMRVAIGANVHRSFWSTTLAEACASLGLFAEAFRALADGFSSVETQRERFWAPEVYRLFGELSLRAKRAGVAGLPLQSSLGSDDAFMTALQLAGEMGSTTLRLRAAISAERFGSTETAREFGRNSRLSLQAQFPSFSETE
jgi:DNA-binding winged helix-turn-helix (wHTH) protein